MKRTFMRLLMVLSFVASAALIGCGGSEKGDQVDRVQSAATNAGPYTIGDNQIPDALTPAIAQFGDKDLAQSELGPKNSNTTKLLPIATAPVPMLDYTNPNANTDLKNIWLDTRLDTSGAAWLYFGWERDAANGSAVIMIEFQHGGVPAGCAFDGSMTDAQLIASCNPWAGRNTNDFIIIWDNSGGKVVISKRVFTKNVATDGTVTFSLSANQTLNESYYKAAYNTTQTMGEAAIKLVGGLFPETPTSCESIGNIIPGTVTGNSDTADYKDTVFANYTDYVTVSLCGDVKIIKATGGEAGGPFNFTVDRTGGGNIYYTNDKPTDQAIDKYSGSLTRSTTATANPFVIVDKLIPATDYRLLEGTIPSGWDFVSYACTLPDGTTVTPVTVKADGIVFTVVASQRTTCTITNKLQQGAIKICKGITGKTDLLSGATFKLFSGSGTTGTEVAPAGGKTTLAAGCVCWDHLAWGTYTAQETAAPSGFALPTTTTKELTVSANATCDSTTGVVSWTFYDDPLSDLEVKYSFKFTGQTTYTSATLVCTDMDGGTVGVPTAVNLTSGTASVYTNSQTDKTAGDYTFSLSCKVTIVDP